MGVTIAAYAASRRRRILATGQPMTLRRQTGVNPATYADVVLTGVFWAYTPERITGGVQQGDATVSITSDEIATAGWPAPPRARDLVIAEGRTWSVVGASPVSIGSAVLGYSIWIRGGQ